MKGILLSGALSALFAFFATPLFIKFLTKKGYSQMIRDDGPTTHQLKRGTPTMGGIILIAATLIGYFISHLITAVPPTTSALLVLGLIIGLGAVGFTDDWIKVRKQRAKNGGFAGSDFASHLNEASPAFDPVDQMGINFVMGFTQEEKTRIRG